MAVTGVCRVRRARFATAGRNRRFQAPFGGEPRVTRLPALMSTLPAQRRKRRGFCAARRFRLRHGNNLHRVGPGHAGHMAGRRLPARLHDMARLLRLQAAVAATGLHRPQLNRNDRQLRHKPADLPCACRRLPELRCHPQGAACVR
jgi:hypothetical protein